MNNLNNNTLYLEEKRLWAKIIINWKTGCWEWIGKKTQFGHGYFWNRKTAYLHRYMYEQKNKIVIPKGMEIDHLCRNPPCCNPSHLEMVTKKENTLRGYNQAAINKRKTHCKRGHEFTPENTIINKNKQRTCKICFYSYLQKTGPITRLNKFLRSLDE